MISRRDALRLTATGCVLVPTARALAQATPDASPGSAPAATPLATPTAEPDVRSWPMAGGNASRNGVMPGPIPSLETPVIVRWKYQDDSEYFLENAPLIVAEGQVFISTSNYLFAFGQLTGTINWRHGLRGITSLAFANGVVFATSAEGELHSLNATTGDVRWTFGEPITDGTPAAAGQPGEMHLPVIVDGVVVVVAATGVYALRAMTGDELWHISDTGLETWPVVADGKVFIGAWGECSAYDLMTGSELWRSDSGYVACESNGLALIANDGMIAALDAASGLPLWQYSAPNANLLQASSTLALLGTDPHQGSGTAELHAIDMATGLLAWIYDLGYTDSTYMRYLQTVENTLYVRIESPEYRLVAIDMTTGLKEWELHTYIPQVYPIAIDGHLYLVHDDHLMAIGNLLDPVLIRDVTLRAAPAESGLERGTASAGDVVLATGNQQETAGVLWLEVIANGVQGWIPSDAIDPATMPPRGEPQIIFDPAWI